MTKATSRLLTTILFTSICGIAFSQAKPSIEKEPSWVTVSDINYNTSKLDGEAEDGSVDLLYDQQISLEKQSVYCRKAIRILTEAGIQSSSEISVDFDPSYQHLTLHAINIRRGDKVINQLNLAKLKTIQQEHDLHRYIYDGTLSSILFLEDVRKGDIIEYSYTLKGFNPIFKGKFSKTFDLAFSIPIYNLNYKIITPKTRNLFIKKRNTDIEPIVSTDNSNTIYTWKLNEVKAFHTQDGIPAWYDPYAMVQVSEYKSWKEVNDWAMELFPTCQQINPGLRKKIEEIKSRSSTTEDRVLAALRFVQDDIRYMGIEMGVNSHKPANPNKIFGQRFGDCKDKSYLLCTILQQLGIEADPVLINTMSRKAIAEWLPSSHAFDHATVRVKVNDTYYWFDPTISFQRGSIKNISFPDYQYGLVIDSATTALTAITTKEPGLVRVHEVFNIKDMSGDAKLIVTTIYSGSFADDTRSSFKSSSNYELLKDYKDYYSSYYEHITADSISFTDDEKTGDFISKEYYSLHDIWENKNNVKEASFDAFVINGIIRRPKDKNRTMPFAIAYPAHYKENVEINVPDDWSGKPSFERISTPAFIMTADFSYSHRKFILDYDFENLKNVVEPSEIKDFIKGLDKKDKTAYVLSIPLDGKSFTNKTAGDQATNSALYNIIAILLIAGFIGFLIWKFRNG